MLKNHGNYILCVSNDVEKSYQNSNVNNEGGDANILDIPRNSDMGTLNPNAAPFIPDDINIVKERVLDRLVSIPQDLISCHGHEYPNLPLNEIKSGESSNTAIEDYSEISILNPSASSFKPKVYGNINTIDVGNNDESAESSSYAI